MSWWADRGPGHRRPPARGRGSRRAFGRTWWGAAWVDALGDRARLDPNRLSRGRSYARSGAVGQLHVEPGRVRAAVQGSRAAPYDVTVRVRELTPSEWDRLLDVVAAEVGHTAALLDGEVPPGVDADAAAAGVELLPGPGDLGPRCSCPDWANPCKHAAAVCFLVADELDRDPFALLLLRGRGREAVLDALRARRGGGPGQDARGRPTHEDPGVLAAEAFRTWAPGPAPALPLPPARAGRPASLPPPPGAAGAARGTRRTTGRAAAELADDLDGLAFAAAARALALATTESPDDVLALDPDQDLARLAADALGTPRFAVLAGRAGIRSRELARRAIAWRHAGAAGLAVLDGGQERPADDVLAEARAALGPGARARGGRVTAGPVQLRWGADGQWYPMRRSFGDWDLVSAPHPDPVVAAGRARG